MEHENCSYYILKNFWGTMNSGNSVRLSLLPILLSVFECNLVKRYSNFRKCEPYNEVISSDGHCDNVLQNKMIYIDEKDKISRSLAKLRFIRDVLMENEDRSITVLKEFLIKYIKEDGRCNITRKNIVKLVDKLRDITFGKIKGCFDNSDWLWCRLFYPVCVIKHGKSMFLPVCQESCKEFRLGKACAPFFYVLAEAYETIKSCPELYSWDVYQCFYLPSKFGNIECEIYRNELKDGKSNVIVLAIIITVLSLMVVATITIVMYFLRKKQQAPSEFIDPYKETNLKTILQKDIAVHVQRDVSSIYNYNSQ